MASYSTIPEEELVERPKQKTSLTRLVASAALVSFALGACAATLTYPHAGAPDSRPELVTKPKVDNHWYDTEPGSEPDQSCWTVAEKYDWTLSNGQTMNFWTSNLWGWDDCQHIQDIETLVFVFHGNSDDGDFFLSEMWNAILVENGGGDCNVGTHYVIAPQFWKSTNVRDPSVDNDRNIIKWISDTDWATGQQSRTEHGTIKNTLSSYQVLDEMIGYSTRHECTPNLKRVVLAGFSGGGQLVQRYALSGKGLIDLENSRNIPIDVFIGAPASIAYMSGERPELGRVDACWKNNVQDETMCGNKHYGEDKSFPCRLDVASKMEGSLDDWSKCLTVEPFSFVDFSHMAENQKMKVTTKEQIRWRNRDIDKTDDSCVYHGTKDPKKKTYWNQWKFQMDADSAPKYIKDNYFKHKSLYEKAYAARYTAWFVGSHDGESAAKSTWEHCADYVQGDSHLTIATAAVQYTWKYFNERNIKNAHDLFILPNIRHVYQDAIGHSAIRSCLVNRECWDLNSRIHGGCRDDGATHQVVFDEDSWSWICDDDCDKDGKNCNPSCTGKDCDEIGIHSACSYPQTPMWSDLHNQWRCAWPNMDGWQ